MKTVHSYQPYHQYQPQSGLDFSPMGEGGI